MLSDVGVKGTLPPRRAMVAEKRTSAAAIIYEGSLNHKRHITTHIWIPAELRGGALSSMAMLRAFNIAELAFSYKGLFSASLRRADVCDIPQLIAARSSLTCCFRSALPSAVQLESNYFYLLCCLLRSSRSTSVTTTDGVPACFCMCASVRGVL